MATVQGQHLGGDLAPSQDKLAVTNPATGQPVAEVAALSREQTLDLVARARRAQPAWEALGFDGRARVMRDLRKWAIDNRDRVLRTLSEESGKPRVDAQIELYYTADVLGFWAKNARKYLADERARSHSPLLLGRKLVSRYRPYGVVGVIGPWNYPLINNFGDAVPALMAGNAVVLKPAQLTPLSSVLMEQGLRAAGAPDDVLLVATGRGSTVGSALVDSVDMLHFTGSTDVGKQLAAQAAERLLPLTLELGGNDPMIVLEDADIERAANAAVWGGMQNGGQTCISIERVYVEGDAYESFVAKVLENVRALRQAPEPGRGDVAAVTSPEQFEILGEHVRDAAEKGAEIRTGGRRREGAGDFFEPTVITGVDHSMKVMTEETFGPVLPIMRVRSAKEAVRLANDSSFGLDSSVFAGDPDHGEQIARQVESGGAVVNDVLSNYFATEIPLGGIKESGVGARHGALGIRKFCRQQNLVIARFAPFNKEIYYFPYSKMTARLLDAALVLLFGRGSGRRAKRKG